MSEVTIAELKQEIESVACALESAQGLLQNIKGSTIVVPRLTVPCAPIIIDPPRMGRGCIRPIETADRDVTVQDFFETVTKLRAWVNDILEVVAALDQRMELPSGEPQP